MLFLFFSSPGRDKPMGIRTVMTAAGGIDWSRMRGVLRRRRSWVYNCRHEEIRRRSRVIRSLAEVTFYSRMQNYGNPSSPTRFLTYLILTILNSRFAPCPVSVWWLLVRAFTLCSSHHSRNVPLTVRQIVVIIEAPAHFMLTIKLLCRDARLVRPVAGRFMHPGTFGRTNRASLPFCLLSMVWIMLDERRIFPK